MNVFIKRNGENYKANVWPGVVHFVDFLHPNATEYWGQMLDVLHKKIKFSGIWLDMNEVANFDGRKQSQETYRVMHGDPLTTMTI